VGKTISGATTNYLYDGVNVVQELSGGVPTANLLRGGVDEAFTRTDASGAASFLSDALGSTVALTSGSGAITTQYTYEPFGNTTLSGSTTTNSFAYTGRELDATGLYFYRARYYNPALQRFISEDPIGLAGGMNVYAYGQNDPQDNVDPSGNWIDPLHRRMTNSAAKAAGYSPEEANALAKQVADVDYRRDSQNADPAHANVHAMAGRKQSCEQAYEGSGKAIADALASGDIPQAVHTVEDAYAHNFRPWNGGRTYSAPTTVGPVTLEHVPALRHLIRDSIPFTPSYNRAEDAARRLLRDIRSGSPINASSYLPSQVCGN